MDALKVSAGVITSFVFAALFVARMSAESPSPREAFVREHGGCTLQSKQNTNKRRYCGMACSRVVVANIYQCADGVRVFIE